MHRWRLEQAQDEAWKRAQQQNVRRPQGVIDAEHLDAILEDQRRTEARVLAENGATYADQMLALLSPEARARVLADVAKNGPQQAGAR